MSHMEQGTTGTAPLARGRGRLGAASRRAVEYFVDPGEPLYADPEPSSQDTAEFAADIPRPAPVATVVLPLTRSGAYEREAVDARLAELERELAAAQAAAATPRGAEAEIQYLGEETAEILRVAHQKAEDLVARATADAAALRAAAQADAEATTWDAEQRLRQLDAETDVIWAERTRLTDDTLRLAAALRQIAESAVERFPAAAEEPATPAPAPVPSREQPEAVGATGG
ncbi:MAG: hypothetical protein QOF77_397 [Solirubrobacteraceae bacterium]|jgi:hypothetical protein|nr:hypothetical protein [Solirubrobacteraceae bacterium]